MPKKDRNKPLDVETEEQQRIAALRPSDEECQMTYDEILEHREREKATILASRPTPAPEESPVPVVAGEHVQDRAVVKLDVAGVLSFLGAKSVDAREAINAERRDALHAEAQPHLTAIKSAMTEHGILARKHLAEVEAVALQNWSVIYKATPQKLVRMGRANVDVNQRALWKLQKAAEAARTALLSTFGDATPGRNDIDPVNAAAAASAVESLLANDGWLHAGTDDVSQTYRRAFEHLKVWAKRATGIATSAREAVERFKAAFTHAQEVLVGVEPREDVAPESLREYVKFEDKKLPAFEWSGDVRTLSEEAAAHAEKLKHFAPPVKPGSVGEGVDAGIAGDQV